MISCLGLHWHPLWLCCGGNQAIRRSAVKLYYFKLLLCFFTILDFYKRHDKMSLLEQHGKENLHNRNIDISTYAWNAEHVLLVGELKEQRYVGFINPVGEKVGPGIYHHMKIELLIDTKTMTIKDVAVSLPQIPREDCSTMATSLDEIKGMDITRGFSAKIRKLAGGNKGCVHLKTLLLAMAPAAVQGSWIHNSCQQKEAGQADLELSGQLVDSCWTWRKNGPLVASLGLKVGNRPDLE